MTEDYSPTAIVIQKKKKKTLIKTHKKKVEKQDDEIWRVHVATCQSARVHFI